jgi:hypothetical protein
MAPERDFVPHSGAVGTHIRAADADTGYWNRNKHELLLIARGTQWDSALWRRSATTAASSECFLDEAYFLGVLRIKLNICVLFN